MKFKKFICCVASVSLLASSVVFAAGTKNNTKASLFGEKGVVLNENDVVYLTFDDVAEGEVPAGWAITSTDGYVDTEVIDNGKGVEKNMLRIVDTSHDSAYTGPEAVYKFDPIEKGIVKYETRFKYTPDGTSTFSLMNFTLRNANNKNIAAGYTPPSGKAFVVRDTSTGTVNMITVSKDKWYTLTYYVDVENGVYDAMLLDESTNQSSTKFNLKFASNLEKDTVAAARFRGESYGGIYHIDYIRVSMETMRLDDALVAMITDDMKGFPAEMIDAPKNNALAKKTNIKFNGRYMFTTQAPIVSGDEVLVTAKNIATMFNMAYQRNENGYTLKNALTEITFASDGSSAKKNNASLNLSADCEIKGIQLFVPISDVAEALGLECSFNKETNEVVINGTIQTEVEEDVE